MKPLEINESGVGLTMYTQGPPECYGNASQVCPMDSEGVMQPCVECLPCQFLKACLQAALQAQGLIRPRILETQAVSNVRRFFKRWSDKKLAHSKGLSPPGFPR